jgi:hypothetical protein
VTRGHGERAAPGPSRLRVIHGSSPGPRGPRGAARRPAPSGPPAWHASPELRGHARARGRARRPLRTPSSDSSSRPCAAELDAAAEVLLGTGSFCVCARSRERASSEREGQRGALHGSSTGAPLITAGEPRVDAGDAVAARRTRTAAGARVEAGARELRRRARRLPRRRRDPRGRVRRGAGRRRAAPGRRRPQCQRARRRGRVGFTTAVGAGLAATKARRRQGAPGPQARAEARVARHGAAGASGFDAASSAEGSVSRRRRVGIDGGRSSVDGAMEAGLKARGAGAGLVEGVLRGEALAPGLARELGRREERPREGRHRSVSARARSGGARPRRARGAPRTRRVIDARRLTRGLSEEAWHDLVVARPVDGASAGERTRTTRRPSPRRRRGRRGRARRGPARGPCTAACPSGAPVRVTARLSATDAMPKSITLVTSSPPRAAREEEVGGLHVAVHHARPVRGVERGHHWDQGLVRASRSESRPSSREPRGEVFALRNSCAR